MVILWMSLCQILLDHERARQQLDPALAMLPPTLGLVQLLYRGNKNNNNSNNRTAIHQRLKESLTRTPTIIDTLKGVMVHIQKLKAGSREGNELH